MPTIEVELEQGESGDTRLIGVNSQTPVTYFPTNVGTYETETYSPYLTNGMKVGGTDSSAGRTIHRLFFRFTEVYLPKGSHIEKATIKVFAKNLSAPQEGNSIQTIEFFWFKPQNPTDTAQDSPYGTEAWNYPKLDGRGTFTVNQDDNQLVEKEADVTPLIQELTDQFDFDRSELLVNVRNKRLEDTVEQFPYPRPTTVPPSFGGVSTQMACYIYDSGKGRTRSPKLIITYRNPTPTGTTIGDDINYTARAVTPSPDREGLTGAETWTIRGMDDPANFGNQTIADSHYPSSDTSVIRINAPFPDTSNRLDINCPASTVNAGGTGDNNGGVISGGSPSDVSWLYRFKIDITAFTINTDLTDQEIHIGLGDSDETVFADAVQDYIGLKIQTANASSGFHLVGANGVAPTTGGAIEATFTTLPSTGVFFVELNRLGDDGNGFTHISCALFNDKDYTDLIERVNGITPSGISNLQHLKFMTKNADGTGNGLITVEYGQGTGAGVEVDGRVTLLGDSNFVAGNGQVRTGHGLLRQPTLEPPAYSESFSIRPRFEDFFRFNNNWVFTGLGFAVDTGQQVLDWTADVSTSNNQARNGFDIPNIVPSDTWIVRFKLDIENLANGTNATSNGIFFGFDSTGSANGWSNIGTSNGLVVFVNDTTASFNASWSFGAGPNSIDDNLQAFTTVPTAGIFYIEMKKTTNTDFTINIFSDKNYTQLIETQTASVSIFNDLRAFKVASRDDGTGSDSTLNGNIDDVHFYHARNTFPSANWVSQDETKNAEDLTAGTFDLDIVADSTNDGVHFDLQDFFVNNLFITPSTKWTLRLHDLLFSSLTQSANNGFWIGLSDSDSTVLRTTTQDFLGIELLNEVANSTVNAFVRNNQSFPAPGAGTTVPWATGVRNYIEITRDGDNLTVNIFSDPDFTNLLVTDTTTGANAVSGLRYIRIIQQDNATNSGQWTGSLNKVEFWNGQDSIELNNTWDVVG